MTANTTDLISRVTNVFDLVVSALIRFNTADNLPKAKAKLYKVKMGPEPIAFPQHNDRIIVLDLSFEVDLIEETKIENMFRFTSFFENMFDDIWAEPIVGRIDFSPTRNKPNPESPHGSLILSADIVFDKICAPLYSHSGFNRINDILGERLIQYKKALE